MTSINCTYQFTSEIADTVIAESADEAIERVSDLNSDAFPPEANFDFDVQRLSDGEGELQWEVLLTVSWEEIAEISVEADQDPEAVAQLYADELGADLISFEFVPS